MDLGSIAMIAQAAASAYGAMSGSGGSSSTYSPSAARDQFALDQAMRQWSATEMPSLQMQGLRRAGVNPILAYGNFSSSVQGGTYPALGTESEPNRLQDLGSTLGSIVGAHSARRQLKLAETRQEADIAESVSRLRLNEVKADSERDSAALKRSQSAYYDLLRTVADRERGDISVNSPYGGFKLPLRVIQVLRNYGKKALESDTGKSLLQRMLRGWLNSGAFVRNSVSQSVQKINDLLERPEVHSSISSARDTLEQAREKSGVVVDTLQDAAKSTSDTVRSWYQKVKKWWNDRRKQRSKK